MRWPIPVLIGAILASMALAMGSDDAETTKKLIGVWEVTKSESLPPGVKATTEFTKDGKIKLRAELGDKKLTADGTYKVKGNTIETKIDYGGKTKAETSKIKKLTEKELIVEDDKGKIDEYKRKKAP